MSDDENKETKEERMERLKSSLRGKINGKKLGRMNKQVRKNKYCEQMGIAPDQLEQFEELRKQFANNQQIKALEKQLEK